MATARTRRSALLRHLDQAPQPIYLVDTAFRVVWANAALCHWADVDAQTIAEWRCVYQSTTDAAPSDQRANGLCPPPDAVEGAPTEFEVFRRQPHGAVEFRRACGIPLGDDEDRALLIVVFGQAAALPGLTPSDSPDARRIHAEISRIQFEMAPTFNIEWVSGSSGQAGRLQRQVALASQTAADVVIVGLPGSGRRRIAELIHFAGSPVDSGPLIPLECGLSDAETIQAVIKELYGQYRHHPEEPLGRLLLLDIDRLPANAVKELLGFFQIPGFRLPVIGTIDAAHRDQVDAQLWQRLATLVIELTPLSGRIEDIPVIAQAMLEQQNEPGPHQFAGFETEALHYLQQYSWPGDLGELADAVKSARCQGTPPRIAVHDLPAHIRIAVRSPLPPTDDAKPLIDLDQFLADTEVELIRRAIRQADGNKAQAARLLGISRARLLRRLEGDDLPPGNSADRCDPADHDHPEGPPGP